MFWHTDGKELQTNWMPVAEGGERVAIPWWEVAWVKERVMMMARFDRRDFVSSILIVLGRKASSKFGGCEVVK